MSKQELKKGDQSTEQKIKEAAHKVFVQKGYSGTTTRDIADAAGINNALLNYYFRSKEKLFDIVMQEQVATLFGKIYPIVNNEETTLEQKIAAIIDYYTEVLLAQPGLMLFVLSEMHNQPERIANHMEANKGMMHSVIARQFKEAKPDVHPMQMIMTVMGMTLFPFMGRGVFQRTSGLEDSVFEGILKERKKILPVLIKAMLAG
jgi:AcrR family transcriptional regulator